ncbi:IS3 family transposase [Spiroplasma endosymbiont of Nomada ruficornis]|uniref:IS3 family transposase n=1 Tax=Spiroplasma endosymbiont of Nomada ruficornis TaxID=3066325 RepID=UPI003CC7A5C7
MIQLKLELFDYINWYNNIRIHSILNYLTPVKAKNKCLPKNSPKKCYHSNYQFFLFFSFLTNYLCSKHIWRFILEIL